MNRRAAFRILRLMLVLIGASVFLTYGVKNASASPRQGAPTGKSVWDSVYTAGQAEEGKSLYMAACSGCHRQDMTGVDSVLKGVRFLERWRDDTLESVYSTMQTTMPRNAPGSLTADQYLSVLAYVLQQNTYPVGSAELKREALQGIQVIGKNGAEPVPTGVLAFALGCLDQGSDNRWILTYATDLVRTRNPDRSTPQEREELAVTPPGNQTYVLVNPTSAEANKGRRIEARGFVMRNSEEEGISITSMGPISDVCRPR